MFFFGESCILLIGCLIFKTSLSSQIVLAEKDVASFLVNWKSEDLNLHVLVWGSSEANTCYSSRKNWNKWSVFLQIFWLFVKLYVSARSSISIFETVKGDCVSACLNVLSQIESIYWWNEYKATEEAKSKYERNHWS